MDGAADVAGRLLRARRALAARGIDALLVTPGADLRYLTGYAAAVSERLTCLVLPAEGEPALIVPRLERPGAEHPAGLAGLELIDFRDGADPGKLAAGLLPAQARRIAVTETMPARHLLPLQEQLPGARWEAAGPVLGPLRAVKTAAEVEALAVAGAAIDNVHREMGRWLRPGRTEAEVSADIATAIRAAGHATADFAIVAAGPNAASPHHAPGARIIEVGDPVVVDIGGTMPSGYCSDCTRTYVIGDTVPAGFRDYYPLLQAAQRAAVEAVAPGVSAEQIDATARDLLAAAGYGEAFLHRTGHGIGLETHEEPYLVAGNGAALTDGMIFSVEPGVYLPGRHGARIEDIVACTATGYRRLNTTSTDLVHL